jgi:hypothetical protein
MCDGFVILCVLLVTAGAWLALARRRYDLNKIPMAPGAVPVLGKAATKGAAAPAPVTLAKGRNPAAPATAAVAYSGHLPEYWIQRDFTQVFLRWHETTQEPLLRIQVAHKLFVLVADPSAAATILGASASLMS